MPEKTPRLKPHHTTMSELSIRGSEMYHPPAPRNRYVETYHEKLGAISLTDGVYIPREAPELDRDLAEVMEILDNQVEPTSGIGWPE